MLAPLAGNNASTIFAIALLFAGIASSVTAGMAGGSIVAGIYKEPYDLSDWHSKLGVGITLLCALGIIFVLTDTFKGLIISQMLLSVQLPITIFAQIYLTSSKKVMGKFANSLLNKVTLLSVGGVVFGLNILLLLSYLGVLK
jgi:manganese transport protein